MRLLQRHPRQAIAIARDNDGVLRRDEARLDGDGAARGGCRGRVVVGVLVGELFGLLAELDGGLA